MTVLGERPEDESRYPLIRAIFRNRRHCVIDVVCGARRGFKRRWQGYGACPGTFGDKALKQLSDGRTERLGIVNIRICRLLQPGANFWLPEVKHQVVGPQTRHVALRIEAV